MTKYAVLVLGLLAGQAAAEDCSYWADRRGCERANEFQAEQNAWRAREDAKNAAYERSRPIQVITPDSSYLAYPSMDGRTVQIYDRTRY